VCELAPADPNYHLCLGCRASRPARISTSLDNLTPPHYRWARKEAPELAPRVKPPSVIERVWLPALEARSLVITGPAGSGKTSLGRAIWFERCMKIAMRDPTCEHARGKFVTAFELARARREHRLGAGEAEVVMSAIRTDLLLLDELGAEAGRGDTSVAEVIHERHANDRATIFTTPFSLEELAQRYGDGLGRRIFEGSLLVCLGGSK
jgi:DNA replication protein DnaC